MNLETISSPGGDSGTACSLRTLLTLGCRSETAQTFAKTLQTKLWSLSPLPPATDGLCPRDVQLAGEVDDEIGQEVDNAVGVNPWRVTEARFDWNSHRVDTVVTTVPLITSTRPRFTSGIVYQPLNSHQQQQQQQAIVYDSLRNGHEKLMSSSPNPDMESCHEQCCDSSVEQPDNGIQKRDSVSSVGGTQQDQDSDTSSTTNPLSDSDQYFDFGIETPLELEGSGEDNDRPIVINQDDGLPVDGMESGCIFGSPSLSDSDDTTEDQDEVSVYESLAQSPAVAALGAAKQQPEQFAFERVPNGRGEIPVGGAQRPGESEQCSRKSGASPSVNAAPAHAGRTSPPRDFQTDSQPAVDAQGELEGVHECASGASLDTACAAAVPSLSTNVSDASEESREFRDCSFNGRHARPVVDIVDLPLNLNTDNADSVCTEDINSTEAAEDTEMVRQVIDHLFNGGSAGSPRVRDNVLLDTEKIAPSLIISDSAAVESKENLVLSLVNHNNSVKSEANDERKAVLENADENDSSSQTSGDSSSKEPSPTRDIVVITTEDDDDDDDDGRKPRHRVQRSTSLKTGKTPPGTPGGKKIVRFADALGLDLAAVRTFLDEIPNVPPSAFNDLSDAEDEPRPPPQGSFIRVMSRDKCNISPIPSFVANRNCLTLVATFTQPGQMPDFVEKIKTQKVCLETACMVDELRVRGVVRVLNLDFHKTVVVRYTIDEWRTHNDLLAAYVPNSCDGLSDRFCFNLACAPMLQPGQRLIFALCYRVTGQEFWDSNQGKNYIFQCISNSSYTPSIALTAEPALHDSFLPYM